MKSYLFSRGMRDLKVTLRKHVSLIYMQVNSQVHLLCLQSSSCNTYGALRFYTQVATPSESQVLTTVFN